MSIAQNPLCSGDSQCNYSFHPMDAWGDGWNGYTMTVKQNNQVVATIAPTGAFSQSEAIYISLCLEMPFEVIWNTDGNYANEIGISIRDPFGNLIYNKPYGTGQPGTQLYSGNVVCTANPCHQPTDLVVVQQYVSNATVPMLYWSSGGATQWEIFITPEGAPAPGPGDVGIPATSIPFNLSVVPTDQPYDIYVRAVCNALNEWSEPITYGPSMGIVYLAAFLDQNANGTMDPGDPPFTLGNYHIQPGVSAPVLITPSYLSHLPLTDNNPNNLYDFSYVLQSGYQQYYSVNSTFQDIAVANMPGTTYYFPVQVLQPYQDLAISSFMTGAMIPGQGVNGHVRIVNYGNQNSGGQLNVTFDPDLNIVSVSDPAAVLNPNGFTLDFTGLAPFATHIIQFQMVVEPSAISGSTITVQSEVTLDQGADINPSNNIYTLSRIVNASYDPNDKAEAHGAQIDFDEFAEGEELTYTVRFQNTGTAPAFKVVIEDQLDAMVDEESVRIVATSHACILERHGTLLKFVHDPIYLPQSGVNEQASQGYVTFAVRPKPGFAIGDIIPNTAEIFFDFNDPIITNTWTTEFVQQLGTASFGQGDFAIYPNPAGSSATLMLKNGFQPKWVTVYDLVGKLISKQMVSGQQSEIDLRQISTGMYLVEVETPNGERQTVKLIRE